MRPPSRRQRKPSAKVLESEEHRANGSAGSDDETPAELRQQRGSSKGPADPEAPKRKRGRPRKAPQQAVQPGDEQEGSAAAAADTQDIDQDEDERDELIDVAVGDWTEEESSRLAELYKGCTKDSTNGQYSPYQNAYKSFWEKKGVDPSVTSSEDIRKMARWYDLFCQGKAGGKVGQRKSETGALGPQGAMTVHSALKRLVFEYCMKAKAPALDLLADLRYRILYKTYTKGRGFKRVHETHKTFTRDDHVTVMPFRQSFLSAQAAGAFESDGPRPLHYTVMRLEQQLASMQQMLAGQQQQQQPSGFGGSSFGAAQGSASRPGQQQQGGGPGTAAGMGTFSFSDDGGAAAAAAAGSRPGQQQQQQGGGPGSAAGMGTFSFSDDGVGVAAAAAPAGSRRGQQQQGSGGFSPAQDAAAAAEIPEQLAGTPVFITPGGSQRSARELQEQQLGYTPNGWHLRGSWFSQQEPFMPPPQVQQPAPCQQQQQQPMWSAEAPSCSPHQLQQQLEALDQYIELLQNMGDEVGENMVQQQHLHSLQQLRRTLHAGLCHSRAQQAAADFDARVRGDPFAAMMHPSISSNPRLAGVLGVGSSMSSSSSSNPAAGMYGAMKVAVQESLMELLGGGAAAEALASAVGQSKVGWAAAAGAAHAGVGRGVGVDIAGSSAAAAAAAHAAPAAAMSGGSSGNAARTAGAQPVAAREVPKLSSWATWESMWEWFHKAKIPHPSKPGQEATRAELYEAQTRWAPVKLKARASEYNVIYYRINKYAVELTQSMGRPVSADEAAQELVVQHRVMQGKDMTMYKFYVLCSAWAKEQKQAAAAADGDADGEAADEGGN